MHLSTMFVVSAIAASAVCALPLQDVSQSTLSHPLIPLGFSHQHDSHFDSSFLILCLRFPVRTHARVRRTC
ncbi:hypothetical protein C8R42DRAFT_346710 [Lentinula raphanica]|nr:hypothetical protein C8R42DRAFT_346710 [Lentinula raphanica]